MGYYGRSAEKIDPNQLLLFESLLNQLAPPANPADSGPTPGETESAAPESRKPKGNGHGRRRLPTNLEREKRVHDLPEEQKPCPGCGTMRHVIGQEISEQLDYVPARLRVIEHVRLTYACRQCESQAAEGGPQITTADKPVSPIEKGLAAPGLLAHVIVSKYSDHLPLYRLERILERHGIQITRSTMCGWMAQCADLLRPLYDRMVHQVLGSKVIHTDDTPVEVLDPRLDQTRTGRLWVYLAIDNNASENALRRVALGRKNWLFCGSDNGGATAATLFSLIATCQRHNVEPYAYLRDVLARIAATPLSRLDELLPGAWQPTAPATTN